MENEMPFPMWNKDDFIMSEEPYLWLYELNDRPFEQRRYKEMIASYAKSVGYNGFVGMWNAYLKEKGNSKSSFNVSQFEGQEEEYLTGPYICTDEGITVFKGGLEVLVCPHAILPTERLVNIDTGEERLKIAYKKGGVWRETIVEKSVIASSTAILQLAAKGVVVNSENAKHLSTYLLYIEQANYDLIEEKQSVSRLGWIANKGFAPYVEGLTYDGEDNFKHIFNAVTPSGSYEKWIEIAKKVRKESIEGRLTLAASFASVLLNPCGLLPFFLHLWGTTENGKTVSLMLASSVWANPTPGEYITTFNSTAVGQEMTASFLNSLPMCIDELQIKSSEGTRDFDKMIYQLTEGIGKARGTKTGGLQRQNTWKNCFITSGEQPITNAHSMGGAVNRIIEIEYEKPIYSDLVTLAETVKQNYGYAGRKFVEYLQDADNLKQAQELQKSFYKSLIEGESTDKQAASMSAILTADKIATKLIFKDNHALTVEEVSHIMTSKSDVDVNRRAYDYVMELIETHPFNFAKNQSEVRGECWGIIEPFETYIIKPIFDREMLNAGFNPQAFLSWAKRNGKTNCEKDRTVKMKRIFENNVRCVCILKQEDDLVGDDDILG